MVMKPGFADYKVSQVLLEPTREFAQKISLKVGSINEEVDVVAEGIAKTPPAETPGKPARVRLGGDIQAAKSSKKYYRLSYGSKIGEHRRLRHSACHHWNERESALAGCGEYPDRSRAGTRRCRGREQMALQPNAFEW